MSEPELEQAEVDRRNASFWQELCGSALARASGISGTEDDALERFDEVYFGIYPYLRPYVDRVGVRGADVLEIGLGYGSLGGYLVSQGASYHGLDIARAPVETMRHRLALAGYDDADPRVRQGSALEIPWADESFDCVFSIGCLHHTGDLGRSIDEVHRVLRRDGTAVVMLYNRWSARQIGRVDLPRLLASAGLRRGPTGDEVRGMYDASVGRESAPHTDFVSRRDVRRLFGSFHDVQVEARNCNELSLRGHLIATRATMLRTPLPRLLGLDLYVVARA